MTTTLDDIPASPETIAAARGPVRELLLRSKAFRALPPETQQAIARDTVAVAATIAEPRGGRLPATMPGTGEPTERLATGLADPDRQRTSIGREGQRFQAQAAREGAAVAGVLLQQVSFPTFVASLIQGVFHSIVQSSIEQMEAYGKLVADVAKTLNQFRDENVSVGEGKDHLVDQFPDTFFMELDSSEDGGPVARVRMRDDIADETAAARRVGESLGLEGTPLTSLDDETIESRLVPAARTQLATSRQQLLATMVLMGINRLIVSEGKIQAKVMYDFQARDTFRSQFSATNFEYDPEKTRTVMEGESETEVEGGERSTSRGKEGQWSQERRDASWYSKGKWKYTSEPVLTAASATTATTDAELRTKASLAGLVDVSFRTESFPLERLADSFQIGRIQNAARPGQTRVSTPAPAGQAPATGPQPAQR
jgi:hypothetical protein